MSDALDLLVRQLSLEKIEENLFRGESRDPGWGRVFGGHVLGQSLSAATQTVPADRQVHSLQANFLLPGSVDRPILYDVDRIRDGGSFTTRRVRAIQAGRAIFNLSASFQVEEQGFEHQDPMPAVAGPDGLLSQAELMGRSAHLMPEAMYAAFTAPWPIEIRPVEKMDRFVPERREPTSAVWYRASGALPDRPWLHRCLLAYATDFNFLSTSMYLHGVSFVMPDIQVATLDHAMWFHRPFRMDEWVVHVVESPSASGGRGLVRGRVFAQDGRLVASTVQEGLIRRRRQG